MKESVEPHSQTKADSRSNSRSLIPCHTHHNWCCCKVPARTEILFRGSGSPLCGLGSEDREPMHPHPMSDLGELSIFCTERERRDPKRTLIAMEVKLSRQKALLSWENIQICALRFFTPFQSQGIFILSGNGIVFSGKNELIKDAVCANNDNLRCSKITSLPRPTDTLEIIG